MCKHETLSAAAYQLINVRSNGILQGRHFCILKFNVALELCHLPLQVSNCLLMLRVCPVQGCRLQIASDAQYEFDIVRRHAYDLCQAENAPSTPQAHSNAHSALLAMYSTRLPHVSLDTMPHECTYGTAVCALHLLSQLISLLC